MATEGVKGATGKPPCRARRREIPCNDKDQETWVCTAKGCRGRPQSPRLASAEAKSPACGKDQLHLKDRQFGRAHLARHSTVGRISSLGARLRTREVTGRDASLPAPLLDFPFGLVARETVGALPQTPQGTLSLDPARGNFPLDPFRAIELVALPYFFRVLLFYFV